MIHVSKRGYKGGVFFLCLLVAKESEFQGPFNNKSRKMAK